MVKTGKRQRWSTAGELVRSFQFRAGVQPDKISILNAVWEKELGHFSRHWSLLGVRRGTLYIRPRSSAAAHELQMRSAEILRDLNKYVSSPWIKAIKASLRG